MSAIGAILDLWEDPTGTYSRPHRPFGLGDCYMHHDGSWWVYCQAAAALSGDGYVVGIDYQYRATELTETIAAAAFGNRAGVVHSARAVTAGQQGWVQVYGTSSLRVAASAAANTQLRTTATTGVADDAASGTALNGIILGVTQGGTAGLNVAGFLNWPEIGATA